MRTEEVLTELILIKLNKQSSSVQKGISGPPSLIENYHYQYRVCINKIHITHCNCTRDACSESEFSSINLRN